MKDGVIYTPSHIVNFMLEQVKYKGENILEKHVIDNSAGEGAFLTEVVDRYIRAFRRKNGSVTGVKEELEKYIHGIEIDKFAFDVLVKNLHSVTQKYDVFDVNWDIINDNSLNVTKFNDKMHYVVGNPPYIRIHDLNPEDIRSSLFCASGMSDLYIMFFEIGINMLHEDGVMCLITPNSYFSSNAGKAFREYVIEKNMLNKIINLGHYNPFRNATTYTAISIINKKSNANVQYSIYEGEKELKLHSYKKQEFFINSIFYFASNDLTKLYQKISNEDTEKYVAVKNGVATNRDSFYFSDVETKLHTVSAFKISTAAHKFCFFPYTSDGLVPFEELSTEVQVELEKNKSVLSKRDLRGNKWYEFGRSQGIKDTFKKRICINNIVKTSLDLKITIADEGTVVYGGYYMITDEKYVDYVIEILESIEFMEYIRSLNKQKNGKYYFFSSKDAEKFVNFMMGEKYGK